MMENVRKQADFYGNRKQLRMTYHRSVEALFMCTTPVSDDVLK
jgi:hypothetical protein